ncbi:protein Star-like [Palaemon carinicauda]|uniref:protein Star-like n=1 Tax=Palaemon carinicauda TaxID=392227 RepID=UPI0035B652B2
MKITVYFQVEKMLEVQCVPVYTVIKALGRTHIDFFSLDVERAEMGILDTIPWDKLSFSVLAIEHATKDDLVAYLDERGYAHVASQSEDHIFVNKADLVPRAKEAGL